MNTVIVAAIAVAAILISLVADRRKTKTALRIAGKRLLGLLPSFLTMLAAVSVVLTLIPEEMIARYLGGENRLLAGLAAAVFGSITLMPGFIAFPVAWALRRKGARLGLVFSYVGLSGVCRIPMTLFEISFMGVPFTVIRYLVSVPLVILFSEILGSQLSRRGYRLSNPASRG
jgi:uncharacterized membrane protein YraQ (UPF0718 family)